MAISGLHLSFVGIGMYKILRRLTGSYPVGGAFGILFLMLYILMIGFTVSAVRALVMFLFRVGADMAGRHYDAPTALSAAAVVVLLWRPLSLYDGGFWLSFVAVFAVLTVVRVVQEEISVYTLHNNGQQVGTRTQQSSLNFVSFSSSIQIIEPNEFLLSNESKRSSILSSDHTSLLWITGSTISSSLILVIAFLTLKCVQFAIIISSIIKPLTGFRCFHPKFTFSR